MEGARAWDVSRVGQGESPQNPLRVRAWPRLLAVPWLAILLGGCAITGKIAGRSMVPILRETVDATYRSRDISLVRDGIPANLLLLRGLCESDPGQEETRVLAVQMFYSYGFGFLEDTDPSQARESYREGLRLGREGLQRYGWFRRSERGAMPEPDALQRVPKESVPLLFWTLANWASLVSLSVSDPEAVADLPRIEAYLRRILELDPEYFQGMPHVMEGTILTLRPRMAGGNPEEGLAHFQEAFRISGRKLLLFQVLCAKYYCRQMMDAACFDANLKEVLDAPDNLYPEFQLLNQIARAKAGWLMERRDDYF
jgi:hypothetical protein